MSEKIETFTCPKCEKKINIDYRNGIIWRCYAQRLTMPTLVCCDCKVVIYEKSFIDSFLEGIARDHIEFSHYKKEKIAEEINERISHMKPTYLSQVETFRDIGWKILPPK